MSKRDFNGFGHNPARRQALSCLAGWTGAAVVWYVAGGVPRALGATGSGKPRRLRRTRLTFVQISDTHIGFHKHANPDVVGSLRRAIADINGAAAGAGLRRAHRRRQPFVEARGVRPGEANLSARSKSIACTRCRASTIRSTKGLTGYLKHFDHDGKNGVVQFRSERRALHWAQQRAQLQGENAVVVRRRATRVAEERSRRRLAQHADRGDGAHPDVDGLRTVGMGHRGFRRRAGAVEAVRIGDGAERTHPSGAAESRRQCRVAHGDVARVSAADTGPGRHRRARTGHRSGRRARQVARHAPVRVVRGKHALATIDTPIAG